MPEMGTGKDVYAYLIKDAEVITVKEFGDFWKSLSDKEKIAAKKEVGKIE